MDYSTGKLASIVIAALLMSCGGAWLIAWRYRAALRPLMSAPLAAAAAPPAPVAVPAHVPVPLPTLAANRRAGFRLSALLVTLSCLIAASSASLWLVLAFPAEPFAWKRAAVFALLQWWPAVPALGLLWRWSVPRMLVALVVWAALCYAVMLWRSIEWRPLETLLALAVEAAPCLVLVVLLGTGQATRAIAPWLMPPFLVLAWASTAGLDLLALLVERRSPLLATLADWSSVPVVIALFALLPWLIAWWPLHRLGRVLARAYVRKQLSELMVLFTAVWAIALLVQALSVASGAGIAGAALLLPLLWVPLAMALRPRLQPAATGPAATLLVLRVFQRDVQVQALFDAAVERWRLTGNTVLIAGTDLADRTLDADDLYTFLDGALAQRYIHRADEVAPRLAAFDLAPDADGRYRVNECYCHDTTWQAALAALVARSDVVLMDLRGFQAHNAGCLHELGVLARAAGPLRVVVLADARTDRAAARAPTAAAPAARFAWLDVERIDAAARSAVTAALFAPARA